MSLILTTAGLAAYALADTTGTKLQATHMAVGDGGGESVAHTHQSVSLVNETWRGLLQEISIAASGEVEFVVHVPITVGGWYIREVAIYADDVLLAIGAHPELWKPAPESPDKVELVITAPVLFDNAETLSLTVDTTKVLASQEHVAEKIIEHDTSVDAHADIRGLMPVNATTTVRGIIELATNTETTTGTDAERAVTPAGLAAALPSAASVDAIYIGGGAMTPSVTDGAVAEVVEDVVNHLSRSVLTFGATANTAGEFEFAMPDNWDGGTIKAKAHWSAPSGTAGDDVGFLIAARALGDDDALDQTLGTAVTLTDDLIAAGDLHISAASAALTVAGVPAGGKIMRVKITRDFDYGAAPLADDVQLLGVTIQHGITGALAAW